MSNESEAWIAVELSPLGDQKVEENKIEGILRSLLPRTESPHPIFVPAIQIHKNGRPYMYRIMEGYAFIASGLRDTDYFRLERSPYVESVISSPSEESVRVCRRIPDKDIQDLRVKLHAASSATLSVGNWVKILNGSYAKLEGEVVAVRGEVSDVLVEMRSTRIIVPIKNASLEIQEERTSRADDFDRGIYAPLPERCQPLSIFLISEHLGDL